jgi:hypothetical protein
VKATYSNGIDPYSNLSTADIDSKGEGDEMDGDD